jgi:hypothetical protein
MFVRPQAQLVRSPEHQQLAVAFVRKAEAGLEAVDPGARQALVVQVGGPWGRRVCRGLWRVGVESGCGCGCG